jgi:hypothetical protein
LLPVSAQSSTTSTRSPGAIAWRCSRRTVSFPGQSGGAVSVSFGPGWTAPG